jgi:hypothetical protein
VVYPRLRDKDDHLHFQLAGLWEPETLGPGLTSAPGEGTAPHPAKEHPYFSIRGEVVFVSQARQSIIVKVRQSPKPPSKRPMFFKVRIQGILKNDQGEVCTRPLRRFWDIQTTLEGNQLLLEAATDLGPLKQRRSPSDKPLRKTPLKPKENLEKPVKKSVLGSPKSPPVKRRLF